MWLKLEIEGILEDHVRTDDDRGHALPLLHRLDRELIRRGEIFRKTGVRDIAGYRNSAAAVPMPGMLLTFGELSEFLSIDDRTTQEVNLLLDRLVRQGHAFGIDVKPG